MVVLVSAQPKKRGFAFYLRRDKFLYLLLLPGLIYFLLFKYLPMFGIVIAFKDYEPFLGLEGIFTSKWVGLYHLKKFFSSYYSWQILWNSFYISVLKLLWGFPAPILLALMINEVPNAAFKRSVQTVSYIPHFLSMVIVCGIVRSVTSVDGGIINMIVMLFGGEPIHFLGSPQYFRSVLVLSSIWQSIGWGSIIYLAAMAGIDPELYEAATMDGASWLRRIWNVTLPSIMPVIAIQLILRMGSLLDAGFEQVMLLYSPVVYNVADITSTYVYREALVSQHFSFGAAVDLMTSIVGMVLVLGANAVVKKLGQEGIW